MGPSTLLSFESTSGGSWAPGRRGLLRISNCTRLPPRNWLDLSICTHELLARAKQDEEKAERDVEGRKHSSLLHRTRTEVCEQNRSLKWSLRIIFCQLRLSRIGMLFLLDFNKILGVVQVHVLPLLAMMMRMKSFLMSPTFTFKFMRSWCVTSVSNLTRRENRNEVQRQVRHWRG